MMTTSEQRALQKALANGLPAKVERIKYGLYHVPSTSRPDQSWIVWIDRDGTYHCNCEGGNHPACVHRAAVYLAKMQSGGAQVRGIKKPAAADLTPGGFPRTYRKEVALL